MDFDECGFVPTWLVKIMLGVVMREHTQWADKAESLIRDMYGAKVNEATCMNLDTGERFVYDRDAEIIGEWKERMEALGIEVDDGA